jgi:hypothetical protein
VNLKEGKAILERGELLEELFFRELLLRETNFVLVVSVDDGFHDDDAPVYRGGLSGVSISECECGYEIMRHLPVSLLGLRSAG